MQIRLSPTRENANKIAQINSTALFFSIRNEGAENTLIQIIKLINPSMK